MILFSPAIAACQFLAWKIQLRAREIIGAISVLVFAFLAWNVVMLWYYWHTEAIVINIKHWCLFAIVSIVTAKYLQWATGVAFWEKARGASFGPKRLSVAKLLALIAMIAVGLVIYTKTNLPRRSEAMFDPKWYQVFAIENQPIASAFVGGIIYPLHWLVVSTAIQLRSWRLASLILWFPMVFLLRWFTGDLYFAQGNYVMGADALNGVVELLTTRQERYQYFPVPDSKDLAHNQRLANLAFESVLQIGLTLVSLSWLAARGMSLRRPSPALPARPDTKQ
jgi:hypothetical protein